MLQQVKIQHDLIKMKNLLIIYPHWPPSNLAGVHRPRLIANQLKALGWYPIILTVEEKYYEETCDPEMFRTVNEDVEVTYTKAYPVTKPRLIGDIGLRAYPYLYKKAKEIINERNIDFLWIPIPSFYSALLGRQLHIKTGIPYGIDYIDPWVRDISSRIDWRHRLSNWLARKLEPIAIKKAALITGVSYEYYKPVLERNFRRVSSKKLVANKEEVESLFTETTSNIKENIHSLPITHHPSTLSSEANLEIQSNSTGDLTNEDYSVHHAAFPYGFDPNDHKIKLKGIDYPWSNKENVKPWIYAGAFLPNSRVFAKAMFSVIQELRLENRWNDKIHLYFVGTGAYSGKSIAQYAEETGIGDIVSEDRSRYPFLHVLNFLSAAETVMVIGSTEKHYTASKVYQSLLSEKPVWVIFHEESSAVQVMEECEADQFLVRYIEGNSEEDLKKDIKSSLLKRLNSNDWQPNLKALDKYSAKESARKLVEAINKVIGE